MHRCPFCNSVTSYKVFSGGKEWECIVCEAEGLYPEDQTPRRAKLLQTDEGRTALRAEMDQELAGLRDRHS